MTNRTPSDVSGADHHKPVVSGSENFMFLDQALWKQFREAENHEDFTRAWLALQCRFVGEAVCGVAVLGEPDVGPFMPVAYWPDEASCSPDLMAAAERAMAERQGVVLGSGDQKGDAESTCVASPIIIDEQLFGVVAISLGTTPAEVRNIMRQLQWGASWIEAMVRKEQNNSDEALRERTAIAFDMVAVVLEHDDFRGACTAFVTELALRLDCDPVSIGFVDNGRTEVISVSHAAQFASRMNLIRDIGAAMDEAIDQEAVVLYPVREDWEYRVTLVHEDLATTHQAGAVLTIPLHSLGSIFGAITLERSPGKNFDESMVELCDGVASVIGPILEQKRQNNFFILVKIWLSVREQFERLFGPHYFGRKLAASIALLVLILLTVVTGEYRVTSPAIVEGLIQRTVVSPFDGYLATQHVRAGEIVDKSQVMATLDDRELTLERIRWSTKRRQHLTEYDRALARQERAEANIVRAQIEQAEAQVALLDEQLSRTQVKAPFEGIVVSGDLSQSVGVALQRGQELFKIAPLNEHRVILEIDESDIKDIHKGQTGILRLAAAPEESIEYRVERITPVAEQAEGRNFFRVEASLSHPVERLRPGMEGVAKTRVEERQLISIWTEKLVNWVRLAVWKWMI